MSSDSEFEEIKIADVKEALQKKQQEIDEITKKTQKKKKRAKLSEKFQEDLDETFNNKSSNTVLLQTNKVKNKKKIPKSSKQKFVYEKDDFILNVVQDNNYPDVPSDIIDFKKNHFFGKRLKRTNINKILSIK